MGLNRALVTGGAGFVGSSLVRTLVDHGWQVTVYDQLNPGQATFLPADSPLLQLIIGDILDEACLTELLISIKPAVVFHLAAIHYIPYCNAHPLETLRVNVEGTESVLRACAAAGVQGLVYTSTAAVYPPQAGPLSETTVPAPMDIYGYSKLFSEQLVAWHQAQTHSTAVIARLFNVYGPRETSRHLIPELIDQIVGGVDTVALGNLEPKRDYVHVEDVAQALFRLAIHAQSWPDTCLRVNVGTGIERSAREVLDELQQAAGRTLSVRQDPTRMRPSDRPHLQADVNNLRALLGWSPSTDFAGGLERLLRWTQERDNQNRPIGA